MSKKLFSLVCIIMAAAMLIAGCAKEPGGENTAAPSEEAGAAKEDLTVVVKADVRSFDPIFGNDTAGHAVFRHIYETLVKYDADGNLVPNLAESVTWTDNKDCEISHNLSVVKHVSDRIAVMYLGKIVELTDYNTIFREPLHPYTQALISAIPIPKVDVERERIILEGDVPSPVNPPAGCRFYSRCKYRKDICKEQMPELKDMGSGHYVACHLCDRQ